MRAWLRSETRPGWLTALIDVSVCAAAVVGVAVVLMSGHPVSRTGQPSAGWPATTTGPYTGGEPGGVPTSNASRRTIGGEGTYLVPLDMPRGTWRTEGPADGNNGPCYWESRKANTGRFTDVLTMGVSKGPATVHLDGRAMVLYTEGCDHWDRVP